MSGNNGIELALQLNSGIPVVQLAGAWGDTMERVLREQIAFLISAGHFDVIINLKQVTGLPAPDRSWHEGLGAMGAALRARCGHLNVVGTVDQVREGLVRCAHSCWSWALSDQEAVCRVKGIPNGTLTDAVNACLARGMQ